MRDKKGRFATVSIAKAAFFFLILCLGLSVYFYRIIRVDSGHLILQVTFLFFHLMVLPHKQCNHRSQNQGRDQIPPAKAEYGVLKNI
jgi:hypothetical protein